MVDAMSTVRTTSRTLSLTSNKTGTTVYLRAHVPSLLWTCKPDSLSNTPLQVIYGPGEGLVLMNQVVFRDKKHEFQECVCRIHCQNDIKFGVNSLKLAGLMVRDLLLLPGIQRLASFGLKVVQNSQKATLAWNNEPEISFDSRPSGCTPTAGCARLATHTPAPFHQAVPHTAPSINLQHRC